MTLPHTEPHLDEVEHAINSELAQDFPEAKLRHVRDARAGPPTRPPAEPKAGAGVGSWGPSSPTPPVVAQVGCIIADTQRLIDTLTDMQKALAIIKEKLG
jgi:hypothetical protein